MKIASIDIGTNTLRILIVECDNNKYKVLHQDREIVRLGEGLSKNGFLSKEPMERALVTLKRFKKICEDFKVDKVIPIATSAVREAKNKDEFINQVKIETGWDVRIISGEEEAYFTYLGVKYGLKLKEDFLVFDIGGGSTEYICCYNESVKYKSTNLGVVKLTEKFLKHDPPKEEEIENIRKLVKNTLKGINMKKCKGKTVVGTAGTPTTIAAIDMKMSKYDPNKVHGYRISLERIEEIFEFLKSIPQRERRKVPGLEKGREDLIIPGLIITIETLKAFKTNTLLVSEWGIREGVIIYETACERKVK